MLTLAQSFDIEEIFASIVKSLSELEYAQRKDTQQVEDIARHGLFLCRRYDTCRDDGMEEPYCHIGYPYTVDAVYRSADAFVSDAQRELQSAYDIAGE